MVGLYDVVPLPMYVALLFAVVGVILIVSSVSFPISLVVILIFLGFVAFVAIKMSLLYRLNQTKRFRQATRIAAQGDDLNVGKEYGPDTKLVRD